MRSTAIESFLGARHPQNLAPQAPYQVAWLSSSLGWYPSLYAAAIA